MKRWFKDVWEGFYTVLVGMKITWRHLFTQHVTLQYPEERWNIPPKSRMRLFMKYEDCIGCGQCVRACPVDCIYIKTEKRPKDAPAIFASNGQGIKLDVKVFDTETQIEFIMRNMFGNPPILEIGKKAAPSEELFPNEVLDEMEVEEFLELAKT